MKLVSRILLRSEAQRVVVRRRGSRSEKKGAGGETLGLGRFRNREIPRTEEEMGDGRICDFFIVRI